MIEDDAQSLALDLVEAAELLEQATANTLDPEQRRKWELRRSALLVGIDRDPRYN